MKKLNKLLCIFLCVATLFALSACTTNTQEVTQDTSPLTMFVPLGNGETYFRALAENIKTDLGIDVEFVYQINCNTTEYTRSLFKNNDLPADIVFTSSKTNNDILKGCCIDLLGRSSVTSLFTQTALHECTTEDGAIYQLPITTKLIGVTYNETLLNEMGWEVPNNFDDMVELKSKCDEAGITFAICDGAATGHGFNWLFHLMGSEWLSTLEGTSWLEAFQAGTASIDAFKEKCEYFKKWTDAGLWGKVHNQDWSGNIEFSQTRALFWYGITNSVSSYDGVQLDANGNETGTILHDTYKTLPWLSGDGSNNCFTYYDSCWVYLNKNLEASDQSEKLKQALKIVEYLASDSATELVSNISKDTYVSVNDYVMGDDRLYSAYNDEISSGFIQPWYYNWFDSDSINFGGAAINEYILGKNTFDNIFDTLDKYNQLALNNQVDVLANFPDGLGYEDTAKLVALATASALDMTLEENGITDRVSVAIMPYTPAANMLPPWRPAAVCNSVIYKGDMDKAACNMIFAPSTSVPTGIYMKGSEIKTLVEKGFDPSDRFINAETGESTFDAENYGPYPYVCMVKGNAELEDSKEYLVALYNISISAADFNKFSESGKVITDLKNAHTNIEGLKQFADAHPVITSEDLVW